MCIYRVKAKALHACPQLLQPPLYFVCVVDTYAKLLLSMSERKCIIIIRSKYI